MNLTAINTASIASLLDKVALNPQPLPPGKTANHRASPFDKVALNPQPLPPRMKLGAAFDDFCGTRPPNPPHRPSSGLSFPNAQVLRGVLQLEG